MKRIWIGLVFMMCLLAGCVNAGGANETLPKVDAAKDASIKLEYNGYSAYPGGLIISGGHARLAYYFDFETKQMIPICEREGCEHLPYKEREEECPAALISHFGSNIAVYDDKIWTVHEWESTLWSADLNGENFQKQCDIPYTDMLTGGINDSGGCYYDGYLYAREARVVEDGEEMFGQERLIAISLDDGNVTVLEDWRDDLESYREILGAYGDDLYYRELYFDDNMPADGIYRVSRTTLKHELVVKDAYAETMIENQIVYTVRENEMVQVYLFDVASGESHKLTQFEYQGSMVVEHLGEKIKWNSYDEETQMYTAYLYTIADGTVVKAQPYDYGYMFCAYDGTGYLLNGGMEGNSYWYITEEDLVAGKEPELLLYYGMPAK